MSVMLVPGTEIVTRQFGPAVVRAASGGGLIVDVLSMGIAAKIAFEDVISVSGGLPISPEAAPEIAAQPDVDHCHDAAALEALRFGIVPSEAVRDVTVGYEPLSRWVLKHLPDKERHQPVCSEICAPFGFGKSHTLELVRTIAVAENYAVAHVEVNGNDISLSDPGNLSFHLWSSLRLPDTDQAYPLLRLHQRALERGSASVIKAVEFAPRVQKNLRTVDVLKRAAVLDEVEERVEDLLCGDQSYAPTYLRRDLCNLVRDPDDRRSLDPVALIARSVDDRGADFARLLLGYSVIARHAGYEGLVITLDEFETEYVGAANTRFDRLVSAIRMLALVLDPQVAPRGAPLALFIASVGQGGSSEDPVLKMLREGSEGGKLNLKPWTEESYVQLGDKLHDLYSRCYGSDGSEADRRIVRELIAELKDKELTEVRFFIRHYIAHLDQELGPPSA